MYTHVRLLFSFTYMRLYYKYYTAEIYILENVSCKYINPPFITMIKFPYINRT